MPDADAQALTKTLQQAGSGDPRAAADLLPLVYDGLRRFAQARLARMPPGQTLAATALVHEAFLRLVGATELGWNSRGHFFAAAAQAIRQILIDQARRKAAVKHGGQRQRVDADPNEVELAIQPPSDDMLALDDSLSRLEREDPRKAKIVMLRYFAGLSNEETAEVMQVSASTIEREWRFARTLLYKWLNDEQL